MNTEKNFQIYINYVVCKLNSLVQNNRNFYGFILTMWYVNVSFTQGTGVIVLGFILTMWYVNSTMFNKDKVNFILYFICSIQIYTNVAM